MSVNEATDPRSEPLLAPADQARRLRNGIIALAVLVVLVVGLLFAVPGLHTVTKTLERMNGGWITAAVVLKVLSCLGYVLTFMLVFDRAPVRFAVRVAWTELAFGATVSLGGLGSLAIGAWLLRERGVPLGRVAERSTVLFLLTSAINLVVLAVFGLGLWLGLLEGPSNPLITLLPAAVAIAILAFFLALPSAMESRGRPRRGRVGVVLDGMATSIRNTARTLVTPDWRLAGAVGYLVFDIAVLWACLRATGEAPPFAAIVLAYQIGYLSDVVPIPGNLGVLDGSFIGMLVLYGVGAAVATAATIVYHAIALWVPALIGTIAFIRLRQTTGEPLELRPPRDERKRARAARRQARRDRQPR